MTGSKLGAAPQPARSSRLLLAGARLKAAFIELQPSTLDPSSTCWLGVLFHTTPLQRTRLQKPDSAVYQNEVYADATLQPLISQRQKIDRTRWEWMPRGMDVRCKSARTAEEVTGWCSRWSPPRRASVQANGATKHPILRAPLAGRMPQVKTMHATSTLQDWHCTPPFTA